MQPVSPVGQGEVGKPLGFSVGDRQGLTCLVADRRLPCGGRIVVERRTCPGSEVTGQAARRTGGGTRRMVHEVVSGIGREARIATQQESSIPRDRHRPVHGPFGLFSDRIQRIRPLAGQEHHNLGSGIGSHHIGQVRGQHDRLVCYDAIHHHLGKADPGDSRIVVEGPDVGAEYLQADVRHPFT